MIRGEEQEFHELRMRRMLEDDGLGELMMQHMFEPPPRFISSDSNLRFPSRSQEGARDNCFICFDEVKSSEGVKCAKNHFIHRDCLEQYISLKCREVTLNPSASSRICCPVSVKCGDYTAEQLRKGASQKILNLLDQVETVEREFAKLSVGEQLRRANGDAYQCPHCSFGPVSHFACPDLTGAPSTNKCPKCGFYAARIDEWRKWDGKIADGVLV
jgi:hypothetical protein